jgi:hypothetical protein
MSRQPDGYAVILFFFFLIVIPAMLLILAFLPDFNVHNTEAPVYMPVWPHHHAGHR